MARPASIRELLRLRTSVLSLPSLPNSRFNHSSSSSSSSTCSDSNTESPSRTLLGSRNPDILRRCHSMRHLLQVQSHWVTLGLFQNPSFSGRILKFAADLGELDYTVLVFRYIEHPDTFCINTLIKAYACSNVPHQTVVFYCDMLRNGFTPNSFSFPNLIGSCAKMGCLKTGEMCHGQAIKNGVDFVLPVECSLIHFYGRCVVIDCAMRVFVGMSVRNSVSWNSIVDGLMTAGMLKSAHHLFDEMPRKNVISWNIMITGYLRGGNPGCCLKLFREMVKTGLRGSDTTTVSVLTACGRSARLKEGRSLHGYHIRSSWTSSSFIDTALIDMYSKCRRVDIAKVVFDRTSVRNLVCWNAMILGHCIHGNPEDGISLYETMIDEKQDQGGELGPDGITFIGVLCACARSGLLIEGKEYYSQMVDLFHIEPNFVHSWCLANLFAGVGQVQEAVETLRDMPVGENVPVEPLLWASLLGLSRFGGNVVLGEGIAKALIELEPNDPYAYALLLNIYAVAGQWDSVARMKQTMKQLDVQLVPGSSLFDLKQTVYCLKLGDKQKHMQEIDVMVAEAAHRLSLLSTNSEELALRNTGSRS